MIAVISAQAGRGVEPRPGAHHGQGSPGRAGADAAQHMDVLRPEDRRRPGHRLKVVDQLRAFQSETGLQAAAGNRPAEIGQRHLTGLDRTRAGDHRVVEARGSSDLGEIGEGGGFGGVVVGREQVARVDQTGGRIRAEGEQGEAGVGAAQVAEQAEFRRGGRGVHGHTRGRI